ncbi:hypothetical protein D3C81_2295320 [compost metagenome]
MSISRHFNELGYNVCHIINQNEYLTHAVLEQEMVKKYFGDVEQLDLFSYDSQVDKLQESYEKNRKAFGYKSKK